MVVKDGRVEVGEELPLEDGKCISQISAFHVEVRCWGKRL
jgi:hypothetical protein